MNIYDIAAKCGVSIATVSRVLNNSPSVRPQTREKVLAVMQEENYSPNAFAQGLGLGSMRMVGIVCSDLRSPFCAEAVTCVEKALRARRMRVTLRCADAAAGVSQALADMAGQNVDAILLVGSVLQTEEDVRALTASAVNVPVILIGDYVDTAGACCVTADEKAAAQELVERLMGRQRRRILFLYDELSYSNRQKLEGYRAGYAIAGFDPDDALIVQVERKTDAVNACIKQLLIKGVSFDAVIGADDLLALGTQKALQRIGLSMPVIGFDNSELSRCATPELTSVDTQTETLCATAMTLLDTLLEKQEAAAHTVIPTRLVERDTFRSN